ncbi:tRNA (adenosine(37)-N6)-dimethylallyltransferase MiaA [Pseudohoeflea coraliihabitans]|uniref:tRNA dimethylallyltransferase n=1 Tax=Pseudohoeflea coraliihabitans TaxID=2860393 RepID=A0ABS6WIW2_9HYPH|nr:tRNA (adenosine(37)-N6)-dimethylallyltransferase MiaA [Pseudohoeflea sp. DP4N28-3]MBW3095878.1 tRNA (adenosine(37)-N6)-dimethylallyltransferase MiaA [Pseudohoeflea sp. DP4N28-3]
MSEELSIEGKEAILIAGPTASGKSGLAIRLAQKHDGEIVNADSMQVYEGLRILTARPSEAEMALVPHHLYGHVDPQTDYSTGHWLEDAAAAIASIRARGRLPVIVGGTGLYFRALSGGLSQIPPVPADIRSHWRNELARTGPETLHAELARRDPEMARRLAPGDRQRVLRAVEVHAATGQSIASFQTPTGRVVVSEDKAARLLVLPPRELLYQRINQRLELMIAEGALIEVEALVKRRIAPEKPLMKAIGVPELAAYLAGAVSLEEAQSRAAMHSRRYAKRQMTWLRNQLDPGWRRLSGQ